MVHTRHTQQVSDVNKAKTRAGKARAKADPPRLVMESVTVHVPRKKASKDPKILREGWALLKGYFDNVPGVNTDTVNEFLSKMDNPIEVQLRPMFSKIMELEPGEAEARIAVGQEIDAAIAELGSVDAPQVKKLVKGKAKGEIDVLKIAKHCLFSAKVNDARLLLDRLFSRRIQLHVLRLTFQWTTWRTRLYALRPMF